MKISKVDHMKSGISQEPVDKSGMLYRQSETKLTGKALAGLALITAGTLLMVVFP